MTSLFILPLKIEPRSGQILGHGADIKSLEKATGRKVTVINP